MRLLYKQCLLPAHPTAGASADDFAEDQTNGVAARDTHYWLVDLALIAQVDMALQQAPEDLAPLLVNERLSGFLSSWRSFGRCWLISVAGADLVPRGPPRRSPCLHTRQQRGWTPISRQVSAEALESPIFARLTIMVRIQYT